MEVQHAANLQVPQHHGPLWAADENRAASVEEAVAHLLVIPGSNILGFAHCARRGFMSIDDEDPDASKTDDVHRGWTDLQRREGKAVLQWLDRKQCLRIGFDALAVALRATLSEHVRTASKARDVWRAAPAVLARCNDPKTYRMQSAGIAYAWLHLLDRYVRTWLALEHLLHRRVLPMGRYGVRVLDVGTGPGCSAFATHDFYAAMDAYARGTSASRWRQPSNITCVEHAYTMNHIRHAIVERLLSTGASQSLLGMAGGVHDFGTILPPQERKQIRHNLSNQYEEYYDEEREEWNVEPTHTLAEADREANLHHRYRLFTFSNFLTTLNGVSEFRVNLRNILTDAHPGSVLLMIGGKGGCYPIIRERMARLADAAGFRHRNDELRVETAEAQLDGRLDAEVRWFYRHLKHLTGNLPEHETVAAQLREECEGDQRMTFAGSIVQAFRKFRK